MRSLRNYGNKNSITRKGLKRLIFKVSVRIVNEVSNVTREELCVILKRYDDL